MNKKSRHQILNRRTLTIIIIALSVIIIGAVTAAGFIMDEELYAPHFAEKDLPPSVRHLFGTDWMGGDMCARTIKGRSVSIYIGLLASCVTSIMSLFLGVIAGTFGKCPLAISNWFVDIFTGIPHRILLILISLLLGKGAKGVAIGVIVTHWCSLGRIVQAEVLSLKEAQFVKASEKQKCG